MERFEEMECCLDENLLRLLANRIRKGRICSFPSSHNGSLITETPGSFSQRLMSAQEVTSSVKIIMLLNDG